MQPRDSEIYAPSNRPTSVTRALRPTRNICYELETAAIILARRVNHPGFHEHPKCLWSIVQVATVFSDS
ncbi:hypothetical protein HZH68_016121 [Vespula germanica]|uniref:Uncharacterized protein n=2 Tax=Vespula TaxID=7451 RepID=A0A834J388_VESGE|nr:hypothetical protein HZH68_016121 [Vespula germanica]KAF7392441.1 hypothetical protein H0235_017440 [Vespula pensylvanica]